MKKPMTVSRLREVLADFPQDAIVATEACGHTSTDGAVVAEAWSCNRGPCVAIGHWALKEKYPDGGRQGPNFKVTGHIVEE